MKKRFIIVYTTGVMECYVKIDKEQGILRMVNTVNDADKFKKKKKVFKELKKIGLSAVGYIAIVRIYIKKQKQDEKRTRGKKSKTPHYGGVEIRDYTRSPNEA